MYCAVVVAAVFSGLIYFYLYAFKETQAQKIEFLILTQISSEYVPNCSFVLFLFLFFFLFFFFCFVCCFFVACFSTTLS